MQVLVYMSVFTDIFGTNTHLLDINTYLFIIFILSDIPDKAVI